MFHSHLSPTQPLGFLLLVLDGQRAQRRREERGASAVEWVVIAAIVVGICLLVANIIRNALESKANDVQSEIQGA